MNDNDTRSPYERVMDKAKERDAASRAFWDDGDKYQHVLVKLSPYRYAVAEILSRNEAGSGTVTYKVVTRKLTWDEASEELQLRKGGKP